MSKILITRVSPPNAEDAQPKPHDHATQAVADAEPLNTNHNDPGGQVAPQVQQGDT